MKSLGFRSCGMLLAVVVGMGGGAVMAAEEQAGATARDGANNTPPIDRGLDAPLRVEEGGYKLSLTPYTSYVFESDLKDVQGKSSVWRAGMDAALAVPVNKDFALTLSFRGEYSRYDFSGLAAPLTNGFASDVLALGFAPGFTYRLAEKWTVFGGATVGFSGETNADVGDAMLYGGFGGVQYAVNDNLQLSIGAGASSSFEDDATVYPIFGVNWAITKQLSLVWAGRTVRLIQELPHGFTAAVGAGYETREYRLAEDNLVPGGAAKDTRVPVGFELGWRPNRATYLRASVGAIVYQKYDVDSATGAEVLETESDIAPFVSLAATFRF